MAKEIVAVCDVCGSRGKLSPVEVRVPNRKFVGELCSKHLRELVSTANRFNMIEKGMTGPPAGRKKRTFEEILADLYVGRQPLE